MLNLTMPFLSYHKTLKDLWNETGKDNEQLLENTGFIFCGGFVHTFPNGGWAKSTFSNSGQTFTGSYSSGTVKQTSWSLTNNTLTIKFGTSLSYKSVPFAVFSPNWVMSNLKLFGLDTTKMYLGYLVTFWDQYPDKVGTVTFKMDKVSVNLPGAVPNGANPMYAFNKGWPNGNGTFASSRGNGSNPVPTYFTYDFFVASVDFYNKVNAK